LLPLQEEREETASKSTGRNKRVFLRFIWHPTTE
jgi:hypothetical protein